MYASLSIVMSIKISHVNDSMKHVTIHITRNKLFGEPTQQSKVVNAKTDVSDDFAFDMDEGVQGTDDA
jgi:hypothetical protein